MTEEKYPWITYPHIWKTKSAFMAFIRGGIRKALWNRYPIKLEYIKKHRKKVANPNPRGKVKEVWGGTCGVCGNDFIQKDLQVDHIGGNTSLKDVDDVGNALREWLFIDENDLQFICKPCHGVLSYASKNGVSVEEATVQKATIEYLKKPLSEVKKVLDTHGLASNNAKVRREGVEKLMRKGKL